VVRREDRT